jgi:hypothetical protein
MFYILESMNDIIAIFLHQDSWLWIESYNFCFLITIISIIVFVVLGELWAKIFSRKPGYYDSDDF